MKTSLDSTHFEDWIDFASLSQGEAYLFVVAFNYNSTRTGTFICFRDFYISWDRRQVLPSVEAGQLSSSERKRTSPDRARASYKVNKATHGSESGGEQERSHTLHGGEIMLNSSHASCCGWNGWPVTVLRTVVEVSRTVCPNSIIPASQGFFKCSQYDHELWTVSVECL